MKAKTPYTDSHIELEGEYNCIREIIDAKHARKLELDLKQAEEYIRYVEDRLLFIRDECDWEPYNGGPIGGGDVRIGEVINKIFDEKEQLTIKYFKEEKELTPPSEWYWIRRDKNGKVTSALIEEAYGDNELREELADMAQFGPIERVFTNRVVIGEALKKTLDEETK